MSTDDLTRRARERAVFCSAGDLGALLSELADTVDRLRASVAFASHEWGKALEERDAARAALERVRGYTRIRVTPFGLTQDESLTWQQGYDAAIERLLTILEEES